MGEKIDNISGYKYTYELRLKNTMICISPHHEQPI